MKVGDLVRLKDPSKQRYIRVSSVGIVLGFSSDVIYVVDVLFSNGMRHWLNICYLEVVNEDR